MVTAEQRTARRKFLGSSDCAAIFGLDPFKSALDVWLEKTGRLDEQPETDAMSRGQYLEPALLNFAADWIKKNRGGIAGFSRDIMKIHGNNILASNFDGLADDSSYVVEAKSFASDEKLGDIETDAVPNRVLIQTHEQMCVAGDDCLTSFVPVVVPGFKRFDFRMYIVDRNGELVEEIEKRCSDFMERYVRRDIRPDDFKPSMECLKRMKRVPGKIIQFDESHQSILANWLIAKEALKMAKDQEEAIKVQLLDALGDAQAAHSSLGKLTYLEQNRKAHQVEACSFRVLRFKAEK